MKATISKPKKVFAVVIVCLILFAVVIFANREAIATTPFWQLGQKNASIQQQEQATQVVFQVQDEDVTRMEVELELSSQKQKTENKEQAIENTVKNIIQKKVLYSEAKDAGIQVSEEEYEQYRQQLMQAIRVAENKEQMEEYIQGYGGEEVYWKAMKPTIKQNLAIRKYLNTLSSTDGQTATNSTEVGTQSEEDLENQKKNEAYDSVAAHLDMKSIEDAVTELYDALS